MSNIVQGSEENPITAQMIFNAAWQRFMVEKAEPAVEFDTVKNNFSCRYLTNDGKKCAVGLCIPDGHPAQRSRLCLMALSNKDHAQLFNLNFEERSFLQDALHDDLVDNKTGKWRYSYEYRKDRYEFVAEKFKLTIPQE
jgi:hypothetical protein